MAHLCTFVSRHSRGPRLWRHVEVFANTSTVWLYSLDTYYAFCLLLAYNNSIYILKHDLARTTAPNLRVGACGGLMTTMGHPTADRSAMLLTLLLVCCFSFGAALAAAVDPAADGIIVSVPAAAKEGSIIGALLYLHDTMRIYYVMLLPAAAILLDGEHYHTVVRWSQ
eukprot:4548147-Pyramimonas_sp.AAC.1